MYKTFSLPYYVRAFGANIAAFNSLKDATNFAKATSIECQAGWIEALGSEDDFPYATFKAGEEIERN